MENDIKQLTEQAQKTKALLSKVKRCRDLPKADLEGKYKKAYHELIHDAIEDANKYRTIVMYEGFYGWNWDESKYAAYGRRLDELLQDSKRHIEAACSAAIRAGDFQSLHDGTMRLREMVAQAVTELGGTEDPEFTYTLKNINLEENQNASII